MDRIKEIYKSILQGTEEMRKQRDIVEKEIEIILMEEKTKKSEYENSRDRYYQVAMLAEEGGFILGFQYAVQLMRECFEK